MKRIFAGALLALVCSSAAQAAEGRSWYGLVGGGLTYGGEKLGTVTFTDGSTESLRSGGLIQFYGGVEYRFTPGVSIQTNIGYHVDDITAENGSVRFSRYPLEVLMHFHVSQSIRLGGGYRTALNPKISGSGVVSNANTQYEDSNGFVLEGEYMISPNIGVKLRGVSERYKPSRGGQSADGDHFGIMGTFYF